MVHSTNVFFWNSKSLLTIFPSIMTNYQSPHATNTSEVPKDLGPAPPPTLETPTLPQLASSLTLIFSLLYLTYLIHNQSTLLSILFYLPNNSPSLISLIPLTILLALPIKPGHPGILYLNLQTFLYQTT